MNLNEGIATLGLTLPTGAEDKLSAYLALLLKWNKVYNLTAIRNPGEMVTHHLLDSLAVLPELEKSTPTGRYALADIGSGAGLPGIVLAIARPDWSITSVETVEKKAAFQRQAQIELGLTNFSVHGGRVESLSGHFDAVIARAFASLADFVAWSGHLSDCLWAMKGVYPDDEVAALPASWTVAQSCELNVPGLAAQRHLLQLRLQSGGN